MLGLFKKRVSDEAADLALEASRAERRAAERENTYADVVAVSGMGHQRKQGIVLDLSAKGARLRFMNGDSLIDGMVIKIPRYGITRAAATRWRTRTDIGIEFLD